MNEYLTLAIAAGFLLVSGLVIWLLYRGVIKKDGLGLIALISGAIKTISAGLAAATAQPAFNVITLITELIERAVLAAENAYYNDEITADERYGACMEQFDALLKAANIELTEAQRGIVDTLIRAACEKLGHGLVAEKELDAPALKA